MQYSVLIENSGGTTFARLGRQFPLHQNQETNSRNRSFDTHSTILTPLGGLLLPRLVTNQHKRCVDKRRCIDRNTGHKILVRELSHPSRPPRHRCQRRYFQKKVYTGRLRLCLYGCGVRVRCVFAFILKNGGVFRQRKRRVSLCIRLSRPPCCRRW